MTTDRERELQDQIAGCRAAIAAVRADADRAIRDADLTAAVAEAENQTWRAVVAMRDTHIRRLRAALQTSNDKLAEALQINAKQAQHIRALHAGEVVAQ